MGRSAVLTALAFAAVGLLGPACGSGDDKASETTSTTAAVTTSTAAETTTSAAPTTTGPASVTMAGQTVTTARLRSIALGLCDAAEQAATDVTGAETTFQNKSHDGLHLVAKGLQDIDRTASATLLEAKEKVESDFSKKAPGTQVAADLRSLSDVLKSSLARFNVTVDACPAT